MEYAALKRDLARRHPDDRDEYTEAQECFRLCNPAGRLDDICIDGGAHARLAIHLTIERSEMSKTNAVLDEASELVKKRLTEVDGERERLERALVELGGKAKRSPGRPRKADAKPVRSQRRRRKSRADQAVGAIEKSPGSGASDIAKAMKIKPAYLYQILGKLEKESRIKKQGRAYFPAN
jgi:hypothetical protein